MIGIRRGTTPVLKLTLSGISPDEIDVCYLTVQQDDNVLTKEVTYVDGYYKADLTQEETLSFRKGSVNIQMKIKTTIGDVVATDIVSRLITDILYEEII